MLNISIAEKGQRRVQVTGPSSTPYQRTILKGNGAEAQQFL
jgi:hypothetical protein